MLRSIAKSGLKGRSRQTKILLVALSLAFFFVTVGLILLGTANVNREQQRQLTFGEWQAVYTNDQMTTAEKLTEAGQTVGLTQLIGHDDKLGIVATADQAFWDMANIQLLEGRLPEAVDEIIIGQGQLSQFAETPKVGDSLRVTFKVKYGEDDDEEIGFAMLPYAKQIARRFDEAVAEHWDKMPAGVQAEFDSQFARLDIMVEDYLDYMREYRAEGTPMPTYEEAYANQLSSIEQQRDRMLELFQDDPGTIAGRIAKMDQRRQEEFEEQVQWYLDNPEAAEWMVAGSDDPEAKIREALDPDARLAQLFSYMIQLSSNSELEGFSGTTIQTRNSIIKTNYRDLANFAGYARLLEEKYWPQFDDLEQGSLLIKQEVVLIRDLVLTGIMEDYHQVWDGPSAQYPTAFMADSMVEVLINDGLHQSVVEQNQTYQPPIHLFVTGETESLLDPPANYYVNQFGQEAQQGLSESRMSQILLINFGLITAFSIFQISLVQLKKRQRKFALMRSIGATISQIRTIMTWEAIFLLSLAVPIGVGLGIVVSWLLVLLNNAITGDQIQLILQPNWIILGIVSTLAGALIGLFLPLKRLEQIPLRGGIQVIDKKNNRRTRDIIGDRPIERQSIQSINQRHYRFIRKPRLINTLLFSLILGVLLAGLWLVYLSFQEYRDQVERTDMPDFEFVRGFQQSNQYNRLMMEELDQVGRVSRYDLLNKGEKAFLWYDTIGRNELSNYFLDMLPGVFKYDYYSTTTDHVLPEDHKYLTKTALVVDVYGYDLNSELGQRLRSMVPADFDWAAFNDGDQAIILSPGYELHPDNAGEISPEVAERFTRYNRMKSVFDFTKAGFVSYDPRRTGLLDTDPSFDGLEQITLTIPTGETVTEDNIATNTVLIHKLDVAAVVHALPEKGLWPMSQTIQNPVILLSKYNLERLYPHRMSQSINFQFNTFFNRPQRTERYGNTLFHVYMDNPSAEEAIAVRRIGQEFNFKVNNLYLVKQRLFSKGLQTSLIIGLLCLALLIISLQIQTNSSRGLLETERSRIGVLQSIGVTAQDYRRTYLIDAIKRIGLAVLVTHLVLILVLMVYTLITAPGSDLLFEMKLSLADYPYLIHGLIVLGFMIIGVLAAYWPLVSILKRQPVENIRSL